MLTDTRNAPVHDAAPSAICPKNRPFPTEDELTVTRPEVMLDTLEGLRHHHMPDWIARANIDHFKKLLKTETDARRRAVIQRELAEEEAKLER